MTRQKSLVVGLVPLLLGCIPHVVLPRAPGRESPAAQRAAAWERLRVNEVGFTDVEGMRGGLAVEGGTFIERHRDRIRLANGAEVRAPEDLLPALNEESDAARAASHAGAMRVARNVTELGGASLLIGSLLAIPFLFAVTDRRDLTDPGLDVLLATGGTGLAALLVGALIFRPLERSAREEAFDTYSAGLSDRLGVCQCVGVLCDCRTGAVLVPGTRTQAPPRGR